MYSGNYSAYALKKAQLRDAQYKAYLNQQRDIKHQEAVIAKLKSFNREKSIKRAESREKMLDKVQRIDKPHVKDHQWADRCRQRQIYSWFQGTDWLL